MKPYNSPLRFFGLLASLLVIAYGSYIYFPTTLEKDLNKTLDFESETNKAALQEARAAYDFLMLKIPKPIKYPEWLL